MRRISIGSFCGLALFSAIGAVGTLASAAPGREEALAPFLRAVAARRRPGAWDPVRILHFGDSHVAAEPAAAALKALCQETLGDGGPGLLLPGEPPRPYAHPPGVRTRATRGWSQASPRADRPAAETGLSGRFLEADRPGERAEVEARFSVVRVAYLRRPGGGAAEMVLDGERVGEIELDAPFTELGTFRHRAPDGAHRFEIVTSRAGPVRILGVSLERDDGATYSALGVVGAKATLLARAEERLFARLVASEAPSAVVLSFGTNEASDPAFEPAAYAARLADAIRRLREAAPEAAVLVVAPPDGAVKRSGAGRAALRRVAEAQRRAAEEAGASFFDLGSAMGGSGAAARWARETPPLVQPDGVHFTGDGYRRLARLLFSGSAEPAFLSAAADGESGVRAYRDAAGRFVLTNAPGGDARPTAPELSRGPGRATATQ